LDLGLGIFHLPLKRQLSPSHLDIHLTSTHPVRSSIR